MNKFWWVRNVETASLHDVELGTSDKPLEGKMGSKT
jgi:hypothetical protein